MPEHEVNNGQESHQNGSESGQTGAEGTNTQEHQNGSESGTESQEKAFTQADVDRIVQERLARDRQTREREEQERQEQAEREAERQKMSVQERLEDEKRELASAAEQAKSLAAQADRKLDLVLAALAEGMDPQALADPDTVQLLGAFDNPDNKPADNIKKLLEKFPALVGGTRKASGSDTGGDDGDGTQIPSYEQYQKMGWDQRSKLQREHPSVFSEYFQREATPHTGDGPIWMQ